MFKFAFFVNSTSLTPDNYSKHLYGKSFTGLVCGVNSMELACTKAKELEESGFDEIELCGDFDREMAQVIKDSTSGNIKICYETYSLQEKAKFDELEELNPWGIIIEVGETWEKDRYTILKSEECDTYIACVNGMEDGIHAAEQMVMDGVKFIELCSYYDEEKTNQIIEGIGGAIPVGSPTQV